MLNVKLLVHHVTSRLFFNRLNEVPFILHAVLQHCNCRLSDNVVTTLLHPPMGNCRCIFFFILRVDTHAKKFLEASDHVRLLRQNKGPHQTVGLNGLGSTPACRTGIYRICTAATQALTDNQPASCPRSCTGCCTNESTRAPEVEV